MESSPCAGLQTEPHALETLVLRGRSGDRQALKELIERYQLRIAKFVLAQTRDANGYEDICQAVFVKMVIALPRLRDPQRFEPWLFQIARNVSRDHLRASLGWRRFFTSYGPRHDTIEGSDDGPAPEKEGALQDALEQLSPEDRTLLRLHLEEKQSYRDLAEGSNTTVAAIKSRLYRARRQLRGLLLAGDSE
jgi:RNA polymerase sigma-70 factor (ECF subfamily)